MLVRAMCPTASPINFQSRCASCASQKDIPSEILWNILHNLVEKVRDNCFSDWVEVWRYKTSHITFENISTRNIVWHNHSKPRCRYFIVQVVRERNLRKLRQYLLSSGTGFLCRVEIFLKDVGPLVLVTREIIWQTLKCLGWTGIFMLVFHTAQYSFRHWHSNITDAFFYKQGCVHFNYFMVKKKILQFIKISDCRY